MVEFNPDGSIKLPAHIEKRNADNIARMRDQSCMKIRKEVISFMPPKSCVLNITLSLKITDSRFVRNMYDYFCQSASVPTKFRMKDDRNFEIEIGTDFKRCTDCCSLINRYREFLDGNVIEEKGSCTFEDRRRVFCQEDYFD